MASPRMISVEEALRRILSYVERCEPEDRAPLDALGQVLAKDVVAPLEWGPVVGRGRNGEGNGERDRPAEASEGADDSRAVGHASRPLGRTPVESPDQGD